MLELFRKNLFLYNIFLLAYLLVLRVAWFFMDAPVHDFDPGVLSSYIYQWFGKDGVALKVIAIFLIIFQAIQINRMVSLNRLTTQSSLFPGLFYILLISLSLDFLPLYPFIIGNTFLITMFMDVFRQSRNLELPLRMFNVGFWAGLASLCYWPYIVFLIMGCLGVIHLRTFRSSDLTRALIGCVVPYIFAGTVLYLNDSLGALFFNHFDAFDLFDFQRPADWKGYVLLGIFTISSLIALTASRGMGIGLNIHVRKKISVLVLSLICALVLILLVHSADVTSLLFTAVPLSVLLGSIFLSLEKQLAEILHFILFFTALLFQYIF